MVAHARETYPDECCGVVLRFPGGAQSLYRTTNAADPAQRPFRFDIPAGELLHLYRLMSDRDADHYIVYHSHTMSGARPSPTDLRFARPLVGVDPWPYWLLVSLATEPPDVRVWRIVEAADDDPEAVNGVKPLEVRLRGGPPAAGQRHAAPRKQRRRTAAPSSASARSATDPPGD